MTELVYCDRCEDLYPDDEIDDQCGCRDDGSGQYVVDLPGYYCHDCHMAHHEPDEYDYYDAGWEAGG